MTQSSGFCGDGPGELTAISRPSGWILIRLMVISKPRSSVSPESTETRHKDLVFFSPIVTAARIDFPSGVQTMCPAFVA